MFLKIQFNNHNILSAQFKISNSILTINFYNVSEYNTLFMHALMQANEINISWSIKTIQMQQSKSKHAKINLFYILS